MCIRDGSTPKYLTPNLSGIIIGTISVQVYNAKHRQLKAAFTHTAA